MDERTNGEDLAAFRRRLLFEELPELRAIIAGAGLEEEAIDVASPFYDCYANDLNLLVEGTFEQVRAVATAVGYQYGLLEVHAARSAGEQVWLVSTWTDKDGTGLSFEERLELAQILRGPRRAPSDDDLYSLAEWMLEPIPSEILQDRRDFAQFARFRKRLEPFWQQLTAAARAELTSWYEEQEESGGTEADELGGLEGGDGS